MDDLYYIKKGISKFGKRAFNKAVKNGGAVILENNILYLVTPTYKKILCKLNYNSTVIIKKRKYEICNVNKG